MVKLLIIIINITSMFFQDNQGYERLLPNSIWYLCRRPTKRLSRHKAVGCLSMGMLERVFGDWMTVDVLSDVNQLGLGKRRWNLATSSTEVESVSSVSLHILSVACKKLTLYFFWKVYQKQFITATLLPRPHLSGLAQPVEGDEEDEAVDRSRSPSPVRSAFVGPIVKYVT